MRESDAQHPNHSYKTESGPGLNPKTVGSFYEDLYLTEIQVSSLSFNVDVPPIWAPQNT